mmetsp:Transcript_3679/g.11599  ORF Transcript_3679/g.11599 Transcript_3679/m.11599 type:complete len:214 (-) Transcript_3679:26-667(-)
MEPGMKSPEPPSYPAGSDDTVKYPSSEGKRPDGHFSSSNVGSVQQMTSMLPSIGTAARRGWNPSTSRSRIAAIVSLISAESQLLTNTVGWNVRPDAKAPSSAMRCSHSGPTRQAGQLVLLLHVVGSDVKLAAGVLRSSVHVYPAQRGSVVTVPAIAPATTTARATASVGSTRDMGAVFTFWVTVAKGSGEGALTVVNGRPGCTKRTRAAERTT